MLVPAESRNRFRLIKERPPVTTRLGLAAHLAASLAFALGLWGWSPHEWTLAAQSAKGQPQQGIVAIVNDEAITAYDIEQRARFLSLSSNITEQAKETFQRLVSDEGALKALQEEVIRTNPGKSREELIGIVRERLQKQAFDAARTAAQPKFRKEAQEELIDERLKLQAARKQGIEVPDHEVTRLLAEVAGRNKMTVPEFGQHLKSTGGVDIATMAEKFRAGRAWRELVPRRFAVQVSVSQRDVDEVLSNAAIEAGEDTVELQLQKISLGLTGRSDQTAWTKRYADAEAMRRRFGGCKTMGELAKLAPDSRFEDKKFIKPASIAEPMRSLLLSAKDEDMLPPVTTSAGVDLYAVCGRRPTSGNEDRRAETLQALQQNRLETLARQYLRNLRQEANIEYK